MSKYLGKLLVESEAMTVPSEVSVKYVKERDMFRFKTDEYSFYVDRVFCLYLFAFKGMLECQYKFSVGYAVKEKRDISELSSMRKEELDVLGGRINLFSSGAIDNDYDFDTLCVIHYAYDISDSVLRKVMKLNKSRKWGRVKSSWLKLNKRLLGNQGRKKGSVNKADNDEGESTEDILLRIVHNKKAALKKGILAWYIEACKEECKLNKVKFDKRACIRTWDSERAKL